MNDPITFHAVDRDATVRTRPEGASAMTDTTLIHEALARSRQQEAERAAREYRHARRLTAGRTWSRLAAWAARRADRARAATA